jgi:hypothetical protein
MMALERRTINIVMHHCYIEQHSSFHLDTADKKGMLQTAIKTSPLPLVIFPSVLLISVTQIERF